MSHDAEWFACGGVDVCPGAWRDAQREKRGGNGAGV